MPQFLTIDIHTHILPENWPDLKERYGYGGFLAIEHTGPGCARLMKDGQLFRAIEANCFDHYVRMHEGDACGCHVQVLSTVPVMFSYWAKPEHALDLSMLLNDHIAGVVRDFPKKFIGLGTVPMQSPKLAIKEVERCVKELGLAGIQIGSHVNQWDLNAPEIFEVFEACEALGAAVFVHPWDMMGKDRMSKYWTPWLVGMPVESTMAICSMIFSGVFHKLPNLRVAFAHGGGSFCGTFGRIEHGWRVRPDLVAVDHPASPRESLGKFWVDSLTHDEKTLDLTLELLGKDKVALGTDYPFPLGEWFPDKGWTPGELIRSMPYPDALKADLLAHNALRWLNLSKEQFL